MNDQALIDKYNIPVPRYTSYPTIPFWKIDQPNGRVWGEKVNRACQTDREISLYIHLPYCEQLCTYCGCNKRITKNHNVEVPYIESVLKEWKLYLKEINGKPILKELHLGGGTPTFFGPNNLETLISTILNDVVVPEDYEFGFEAHPNSTTWAHLETLRDLGFNRLSIGVQDFDEKILKTINRTQTYEDVMRVTQESRALNYSSINYDIIFGLPFQTKKKIEYTVEKIALLKPDRLAFYSYAHVPWIKPSQRAYSEADLPTGKEKRELYELGRQLFDYLGYKEIGLDHFALKTDSLYQAMIRGSLHRNFMGYTPNHTATNIALGASSISECTFGYVQNEKKIETYQERIERNEFPLIKAHYFSESERLTKDHITDIMCKYRTTWDQSNQKEPFHDEQCRRQLDALVEDGLIRFDETQLIVEQKGRPFVRNICAAIDVYLWQRHSGQQVFSSAV